MQGRQWAEITRNMMAVRKISGPLQAAIAELDEQSGKLSQIVATLQKRIRAQEVRPSLSCVCVRVAVSVAWGVSRARRWRWVRSS
jgi:hypothetical protein